MADKTYLKSPLGGLAEFSNPEEASLSVEQGGFRPASDEEVQNHLEGEKYKGSSQQIKAALESTLRGATLGGSDILESGLNIATAKDILARKKAFEEENPIGSTITHGAGFLSSLALAPEGEALGLLSPARALTTGSRAMGEALGSKAAIGALEAAGLTGANIASEYALGDPELNSQNIMARVGISALLGGAGGALGDALSKHTINMADIIKNSGIADKGAPSFLKAAVSAGALHYMGVPSWVAAPVAAAAGISKNPFFQIEKLNAIEAFIGKIGKTMQDKVADALDPALKGFEKVIPVLSSDAADMLTNKKKQQEDYDKITQRIAVLRDNPEQLLNTADEATKDLYSFAPNMAFGIQKSINRGVNFLGSKIPEPKTNSFFPQKYVPSPMEMNTFMQYHSAIEEPLSVLDGLKDGTVSFPKIDAVKSVYPELYAAMQESVVKHLMNQKVKPSYQKMLAVSQFLGQDTDSSLKSQSIAANQMSFNARNSGNSAQKDEKIKTTQKGLGNLSLANREMTQIDKAATRAEERSIG